MATVTVRGPISMDALHLSDVIGATITGSSSAFLALSIPRGVIQSLPGIAPASVLGNVSIGGTSLTYDANGQLNGGTVTSIYYSTGGDAPGSIAMLDVRDFSLPAAQLYNWFLTDATQAALSTILSGNDRIEENLGSDDNVFRGYAGNDTITGSGGADSLYGGTGDDHLIGGAVPGQADGRDNLLRGEDGNDIIYGANYFDDIDGGAGDDTMTGGASGDLFRASAGADRITDFNVAQGDQIRIGAGVTYTLSQNGADTLVTLSNGATITLAGVTSNSVGAASISSTATGSGPLKPGGPNPNGPQTYSFNTITDAQALSFKAGDLISLPAVKATEITALYGSGTVSLTIAGKTVVFSSALVSGTAFNYPLGNGSLFLGWDRNDIFGGGGGDDAAFGGTGNDILEGGAGANLLQGNQGADKLSAAGGNDTMYGGQDGDQLIMGQGNNFGQGNKGNDSIFAGDGVDTLLGGQDNDTIVGGGGGDFINGNLGADFIQAGGGNDTLYGEGGNDTLEGDEGADMFRIVAGTGLDRIVDFHRVEGDRIVLDHGATYTASQSGGDVVVNIGGGDQVVIVGVSLGALTGDWISVA